MRLPVPIDRCRLLVVVIAALACGSCDTAVDDTYPSRPIKVIVPFGAGGGSDTFVRILQKAIEEDELLPQPIVVVNVPGAGGTIGSRQVMNAEPDGYTILCLHDGMITAKHSGAADYGPEAFLPIAGTGEVGLVIAVAQDAPYTDLKQLLEEAADRPDEVVFSANIGAPSHFVGLMLERARPGARFRYTSTGGGAKRFAALVGGHIDVSAFSIAEYMQFKSEGLRALAVCGPTRHAAAPDVLTAKEQGFDVVFSNMQYWWAPRGTPADRTRVVAEALSRAMRTEQVRERLAAIHTDDVVLTGDALAQSLTERERRIAGVSPRSIDDLPNFVAWVFGAVVVFGVVVFAQEVRARVRRAPSAANEASGLPDYQRHYLMAGTAVAMTALYVWLMQMNWLGFRVATALFVVGLGLRLTRMNMNRLPALAVIALAMSFGLHYVLTQVFVIDLP